MPAASERGDSEDWAAAAPQITKGVPAECLEGLGCDASVSAIALAKIAGAP